MGVEKLDEFLQNLSDQWDALWGHGRVDANDQQALAALLEPARAVHAAAQHDELLASRIVDVVTPEHDRATGLPTSVFVVVCDNLQPDPMCVGVVWAAGNDAGVVQQTRSWIPRIANLRFNDHQVPATIYTLYASWRSPPATLEQAWPEQLLGRDQVSAPPKLAVLAEQIASRTSQAKKHRFVWTDAPRTNRLPGFVVALGAQPQPPPLQVPNLPLRVTHRSGVEWFPAGTYDVDDLPDLESGGFLETSVHALQREKTWRDELRSHGVLPDPPRSSRNDPVIRPALGPATSRLVIPGTVLPNGPTDESRPRNPDEPRR